MVGFAMFLTLVLFALVVSQPFFYLVALGRASGGLSAPAYVELRQRINAVMNVRFALLYGATAVSCGVLAWAAFAQSQRLLAASAIAALAGLVADAAIAVRKNVPINEQMDAWSPASLPADWESYRARWVAAFAMRQAVLATAYAALLAGVVASR